MLHYGIRVGTITELVGCAGTVKAQLALQSINTTAPLSDTVVGNGGGGGTIWIDTEQKLSLVRLHEMAMARCRSTQQSNPKDVDTILENETVHSSSNINEFMHVLNSLENERLDLNTVAAAEAATAGAISASNHPSGKKLPVRLIAIDSIAAAIGRELTSTTIVPQQAIRMMQIAKLLKRYVDHYSIAILIINQVTSTTVTTVPSHSSTTTKYPQQHQRAALEWRGIIVPRHGLSYSNMMPACTVSVGMILDTPAGVPVKIISPLRKVYSCDN